MAIPPFNPIQGPPNFSQFNDSIKDTISQSNELNQVLEKIVAKVKDIGDPKNFEGFGKVLKEYEDGKRKLDEMNQAIQTQNQLLQTQGTTSQQLTKQIDDGVKARRKLTEISNDLRDAQIEYNAKVNAGTATAADLTRVTNLKSQVDTLNQQAQLYESILTNNSSLLTQAPKAIQEEIRKYVILKNQGEQARDYVKNREKEYFLLDSILTDEEKSLAIAKAVNAEYQEKLKKKQEELETIRKESFIYQGLKGTLDEIKKLNILSKITLTAIVEKAFELDTLYTNSAKQLGISRDLQEQIAQSTSMTDAKQGSIASTGNSLVQSQKNLLAAQGELNTELGTANFYTQERLKDQVSLVKEMGLEASTAAKLQNLSMLSGMSNRQITTAVNQRVIDLRNATKIELDNRKVLDDVLKISGQLSAQYRNNPDLLAKAVVQARELGLTLQQTAGMADKLLNFEVSIESELKAELLTGRAINLEQARYLALMGDSAGAAKELMANVGGLEEFQKLNVIQQRSLAEAIGMSADELSNSLRTQEMLGKAGVESEKALNEQRQIAISHGKEREFLDDLKRRGVAEDMIAQQQQIGAQEKMNLLVDRLLETFSNIAEPITNIINGLSTMIEKIGGFKVLLGAVGAIMTFRIASSIITTVQQLKQAQIATSALIGINQALAATAEQKAAAEVVAASAATLGGATPFIIAGIAAILGGLGIAYAAGAFSGGGESVNTTTPNATGFEPTRTNTANQQPQSINVQLSLNGVAVQNWEDERNKSTSTNKFA